MSTEEFLEWLELMGWRDYQAAKAIGCTRAAVWHWKRGKPISAMVARMCRMLQVEDMRRRETELVQLTHDVGRHRAALKRAAQEPGIASLISA